MAKYTTRTGGKTVSCTNSNFVAKGGEGSIHIIGDRVYKVCDKGHMIPEQKFAELAVLKHPRIIVPDDILQDSKGRDVGYTMRAVPGDPMPLAQILTRTYRDREGVTPDQMMELVSQISDGLRYVHSNNGYFQVDGNELNYMVTKDHGGIYFIDVNSFQTPSFPVNTIMMSIMDHTVQCNHSVWQWSTLSDWYSFAIISWYMFTAIHPFKGMNPAYPDKKTFMIDQMQGNCSVLHPETKYPKAAVYHPFEDVIPGGKDGAYMQWYHAIFIDGKRLPAPVDFQATIAFIARVKEIVGSDNFLMTIIKDYGVTVLGHYASGNKEVVVTKDNVFANGYPHPRPDGKFRVGFTPNNVGILASLKDGKVRLQNLDQKTQIQFDAEARDIMACEGRLYLLGSSDILEINFVESGRMVRAATKSVANIIPNATQFFQGVAIQDMFGAKIASVFPASGQQRQIKLEELARHEITDAKYEKNILMVVGMHRDSGEYKRFIFRFSRDWTDYDCRVVENITPTGLNFTVTDKMICICMTEEEKVEIFSSQMGSQDVKSVEDPAVVGDMRLCHSGNEVRFAHGTKLYKFAMKPKP